MERLLRAKLGNGKVVCLRGNPVGSLEAILQARERLVAYLDSEKAEESKIVSFLCEILPAVFPSADPSKLPILNYLDGQHSRDDITFRLVNSDKIGLVEFKRPKGRSFQAKDLIEYLDRLEQESRLLIGEVHLVAGRGQNPRRTWLEQHKYPFSVLIHTWDDLIERLTSDDIEEDCETIVLVQIVESARHLLSQLIKHPQILSAIDDRRFEELTATLLSDLGFHDVELTPPRKDGGKDVLATYINPQSFQQELYLFECKHWVKGNKVSISVAARLRDVVRADNAASGILLASGGFGPKLIEQEASWRRDKIHLRDGSDFVHWVSAWERQYGNVLFTPVNVLELLGFD